MKPLITKAYQSGEYNPAEVAVIIASNVPGAFQIIIDDVVIEWKKTQQIDTFKPGVGEALQQLGHSKFSHVPGF